MYSVVGNYLNGGSICRCRCNSKLVRAAGAFHFREFKSNLPGCGCVWVIGHEPGIRYKVDAFNKHDLSTLENCTGNCRLNSISINHQGWCSLSPFKKNWITEDLNPVGAIRVWRVENWLTCWDEHKTNLFASHFGRPYRPSPLWDRDLCIGPTSHTDATYIAHSSVHSGW